MLIFRGVDLFFWGFFLGWGGEFWMVICKDWLDFFDLPPKLMAGSP